MKKVYVGTQYIERESKNPDRNLKNTIMDECIPTIRIPNTMGSELIYSLFAQRKFKMRQPSSIIFSSHTILSKENTTQAGLKCNNQVE
jgi:hypothetical protein